MCIYSALDSGVCCLLEPRSNSVTSLGGFLESVDDAVDGSFLPARWLEDVIEDRLDLSCPSVYSSFGIIDEFGGELTAGTKEEGGK